MLRPALIVVVVIAVLLALLWLGQRKLIYLPDTSPVPAANQVFDGGRDVVLESSDGLRLGGWLIPPRGPDRKISILVANGNGGNRLGRALLAEALSGKGFTVLLFDYRGYGGNPGSPSEAGLARDIRAARDKLTGPVIYFGESLGAGVVTELATEHPPAGLVLRSPFVDLAAVGAVHYPFLPVRMLLRDRFPVASHVTRIEVPTVIIYGSLDTIVPPAQSREVARRAAGPVTVVEVTGADHNDRSLLDGQQVIDAVVKLEGVSR
ncbi:MAG TPA: alpha/beta hydrolase, partial [Micromonosporaceae bacterium]|nr:alpha/beta hydrolase [Micromonosporaceae bacterium]